jgi:hypothetical protein
MSKAYFESSTSMAVLEQALLKISFVFLVINPALKISLLDFSMFVTYIRVLSKYKIFLE